MGPAEKPSACIGCPAFQRGVGFVPPLGPSGAEMAFLGQGPGEQEAEFSRPFNEDAPAGWRLTRWINRAGFQRSVVWLGNVVQCWMYEKRVNGVPKGNRAPTEKEMQWCWNAHVGPALHKMVEAGTLKRIFTVGAPASRWVTGFETVDKYIGTTNRVELPPVGVNSGSKYS